MAGRFLGRGGGSTRCTTLHPGYRVGKGGLGASGASAVHFGENFIKQNLQGAPDLVRAGHLFGPQIWIWKDLGLMSFWNHSHSI